MELRPGYKRTEVGVIPEDWEVAQGEEITVLISKGASPRWQGYSYSSQGMLFVTSENVREGFLDIRNPKYLPLAFHEKIIRSRLAKGDILVNLVGASIGRSCQLVVDLGEAHIKQEVPTFRCNARVHAPYVALAFQMPETIDRIIGMQVEAARPNISLGDLRRFWLPIPTAPEQRAIADALGDVDALLAGLDRLIAKKRDLKQAAMQQLLTGQTRLPRFGGEWEMKRLGDHVDFLKHGTHSRAQLGSAGPVKNLHYGDIHGAASILLRPDSTAMPTLVARSASRLDKLAKGDVVFVDASEDLEGVGTSVEIAELENSAVVAGQHTIAARFDKSVLVDGFKCYLQFVPVFRDHLRQLAAGTKVLATNRAHIASVEMPIPSPDEQSAIAKVLTDMDVDLAALEARRDKTRALKQAMMQELLTGNTRLPIPENADA
jgi:type I restriction enzyme S subunit